MQNRAYFVTGTDTEVGKTFICQALLEAFNQQGLNTAAYKPIAAGCEHSNDGLRNQDALLLQSSSSVALTYREVNPIAFEPAIAPHIAAQELVERGAAQGIDLRTVHLGFANLLQKQLDVILVEGAGGWRLPLGKNSAGQQQFLSDFAAVQKLPVILVVGMRLGCLNHALLSALAIQSDGLRIAGWVANQLAEPMPYLDENIQSLKDLLEVPFLGTVPKCATPQDASQFLDLSVLESA